MKFFPFSFFITGYQSQTVEYPSQNIYLKSCSSTVEHPLHECIQKMEYIDEEGCQGSTPCQSTIKNIEG